MQHSLARLRPGRSVTAAAALGALAVSAGLVATTAPASAKAAPSLTPQVIAFPSRAFVSVAEPDGATATTTWTHTAPAPALHETATDTAVAAAPGELGLIDINHLGQPCWTPALGATTTLVPGDNVAVRVAGGAANQQLNLTVADVQTAAAKRSATAATTIVVTGSASDPATGGQVAAGNLQVRLVAKKQAFATNGRRDLRAVLGGGKDGVLNYNHPGSATDMSFTATFNLAAHPTDATMAASVAQTQTRGIVQNDPVDPTAITIYETPGTGPGVAPGPAAGCPLAP